MSLSEELQALADLHQRGQLTATEYEQAKARLLNSPLPSSAAQSQPLMSALNRLRLSRNDRWLGGVCGGLARISGLPTWLWRLGFTMLVLCGGTGLVAYLLTWWLVPREEAVPVQAPGLRMG